MRRHIVLPTRTAIVASAVFVLSVLAHIFILFANVNNTSLSPHLNDPPKFPIHLNDVAHTFVKTPHFSLYTNDSDWDSILPDGSGFFYLPSHDHHYLLSHYHQLHCIRVLRDSLRDLRNTVETDLTRASDCLIYLRQMALCNVDLSLEPAVPKQHTPDGEVTIAVTGAGITHRCTDWSQVWDYMTSNFEEHKESYGRKATKYLQSLINKNGGKQHG